MVFFWVCWRGFFVRVRLCSLFYQYVHSYLGKCEKDAQKYTIFRMKKGSVSVTNQNKYVIRLLRTAQSLFFSLYQKQHLMHASPSLSLSVFGVGGDREWAVGTHRGRVPKRERERDSFPFWVGRVWEISSLHLLLFCLFFSSSQPNIKLP